MFGDINLRQGNTLNVDNIFMRWNVPLIDEIIIDMSSCLLAVAMVTVVPMVTRQCGLSFDQQFYDRCVRQILPNLKWALLIVTCNTSTLQDNIPTLISVLKQCL